MFKYFFNFWIKIMVKLVFKTIFGVWKLYLKVFLFWNEIIGGKFGCKGVGCFS